MHDPPVVRRGEPAATGARRSPAPSPGSGPSARRWRSVSPSSSSVTANGTPSSRPTSWMARMLGCDSAATARASRSKRARQSGSRGDGRRKHLDRHLAAQPRVARPVDLAHAARAERREDLVGPSVVPAESVMSDIYPGEDPHATSPLSSVGPRSGPLRVRAPKDNRTVVSSSHENPSWADADVGAGGGRGLRGQARDQLRVGQDGELRQPEDLRLVFGSQVSDARRRIDRGRAVRRRARPGGRRAGSRKEGLRQGSGGERRHPRLVRHVRGRRRQPRQIRPLRLVDHDDLRRRQVPEEGLADAGHPRSRTETGLARGEGGDPGNKPRQVGRDIDDAVGDLLAKFPPSTSAAAS